MIPLVDLWAPGCARDSRRGFRYTGCMNAVRSPAPTETELRKALVSLCPESQSRLLLRTWLQTHPQGLVGGRSWAAALARCLEGKSGVELSRPGWQVWRDFSEIACLHPELMADEADAVSAAKGLIDSLCEENLLSVLASPALWHSEGSHSEVVAAVSDFAAGLSSRQITQALGYGLEKHGVSLLLLLRLGADPNLPLEWASPFSAGAGMNWNSFQYAVTSCLSRDVGVWVSAGADASVRDEAGHNLLHLALLPSLSSPHSWGVRQASVEAVAGLMDVSDWFVVDQFGATPASLLEKFVSILKENGVDPSACLLGWVDRVCAEVSASALQAELPDWGGDASLSVRRSRCRF